MNKVVAIKSTMAILTLCSSAAFAGSANPPLTRNKPARENEVQAFNLRASPSEKLFSMSINGSVGNISIAYDRITDRVYASYPGGMVDLPLTSVASAYAGNNITLANRLVNDTRAFMDSGFLYDDSGKKNDWRPNNDWPLPSTPMECALIPCRIIPNSSGDGSIGHTITYGWHPDYTIHMPSEHNPWWTGLYSNEYVQHDKQMFEVWRNNQCSQAKSSGVGAAAAGAGAVGTCTAATGGMGALLCAGVIGGALYSGVDAASSAENCANSNYPGPGKWGVD